MYIYYIDMSVLLENIPLVKFIKTTSGTPSGLFSIISHVKFIDDVISVISLYYSIYYINTDENPGELLCTNLISSHVRITCYLHM